jgi:DNA repair protein RecO (recombination protein O)
MQINDEGIIVSKQKFSENSLIVAVFSSEHGLQKGLLKSGLTLKNKATLEVGNIVKFQKNARLENNLGSIKIELQQTFLADVINNPLKVNLFSNICHMLDEFLVEKHTYNSLYNFSKLLLEVIANSDIKEIYLKNYVKWEMHLLKEIGYGLDLSKCVVSNKEEDLYYLSPKTGKAVSKDVGEQYADNLFIIPPFLLEKNEDTNMVDILQAISITTHFFNKFSQEYNKKVSFLRENMINKLLTNT